jgi:hypothetical protein
MLDVASDRMVFYENVFGPSPSDRVDHESKRSLVITMEWDRISDLVSNLL